MTVDARFNSRVIRYSDYPEIRYLGRRRLRASRVVCLREKTQLASIAAILAGAFDPLKIILTLLMVLWPPSRNWLVFAISCAMLVAYLVLAGQATGLGSGAWLMGHLLSIALLVGLWWIVTRKWGWKATAVCAAVAAVVSSAIIYLAVSHGQSGYRSDVDVGAEQIGLMTQPSLPNWRRQIASDLNPAAVQSLDQQRILATMAPSNASLADQPGEGLGYREVTTEELNPGYLDREAIRREAEGGWFRGMGPISEVAKIGGSVVDSFRSGGSLGYDLLQYTNRKFGSGSTDPLFDHAGFIEKHAKDIPPEQAWRWWGARNEVEALQLLRDEKWRRLHQAVVSYKG